MTEIDFDIFEKILVRQAMLDSEYLASISDYVEPKYFNDRNISKYFEIVDNFYEKRNKLPTITEVKTYLTTDDLKKNFKKLIESFKELDAVFDRDELYDNTEKFLKEKGMYHAILESAEDISSGNVDTGKIVEKFEKIAGINLNSDRGIELFGDKERVIADILNEEATIPSRWKWLDDLLGGGFRHAGKALYVFAGQANIGKSIFLGNVAANIALQGKNVLVVTLEMSETLYAQRIASNVTKIPMKDFKDQVHTLRYALDEEQKKGGKIFIKEFPPSTITPKQLSAFVKRFQDSGIHIDAIVIDYLGLLHSTQGTNSYERIKHICEQVRAMSYVFKCPVISASQLNRSNYNTSNPGLDSLAESLGIAMVSDVILSIFQNEEDLELGVIRLGMIKNRFGMRGMTQAMRIDYPTLTITQADEDESEMEGHDLSILEALANQ